MLASISMTTPRSPLMLPMLTRGVAPLYTLKQWRLDHPEKRKDGRLSEIKCPFAVVTETVAQ